MTLELILAWWNLIYILPFGLALLYLILYAASGLTFGEADADGAGEAHDFADADVDHDVAIDHDVDVDHDMDLDGDANVDGDVDADADVDGDVDADHDVGAGDAHDADAGGIRGALTWLGVGRVPLSILLMVLLFGWGVSGFLGNQLVYRSSATPSDWRVLLISLPIAAVVAGVMSRVVSRSISRWLPTYSTSARRRHDLLGLTGVAIYDVTPRFGMVSVHDDTGELYQVPCRTAGGHELIRKNGKAVLVAYNARERLFHVIPPDAVGADR